MKNWMTKWIGVGILCGVGCGSVWGFQMPEDPIHRRNMDAAVSAAFDSWIQQLNEAPHTKDIQTIGVLPLNGDPGDFTSILVSKLTSLKRFQVVVLDGSNWDALENELARQDPQEGFGDIMNKATLAWERMGDDYQIKPTVKGAQAILLGKFRDADSRFIRSKVALTLILGNVETRQLVAGGGLVEGEAILPVWDILSLYWKYILIALGVVAVLLLFFRMMALNSRPR